MTSQRRTSLNTSSLEAQLHQMAISTGPSTGGNNSFASQPSSTSSSTTSSGPRPPTRTSSNQNGSAPPRTNSLSRQASMNFADRRSKDNLHQTYTSHSQNPPSSTINVPPRTATSMSLRKRASVTNIRTVTPQRSMSSLSRKSSMQISPPLKDPSHTYLLDPEPPQFHAPTIVLLHDSSYKHKFSRPNATEDDLESIVERPERIVAATLGACAAQTRLGQDKVTVMKTSRMGSLYDPAVKMVHGSQDGAFAWPEELGVLCRDAEEKLRSGECEVPDKFHQGDLYLCKDSKEDLEGCIGAVYDGVDAIFAEPEAGGGLPARRAFVCIRPPGHHCADDEPSGFCWLNNVHIGIAHAAQKHGLTHAAILDFDLHHGDGSQTIAWSINEMHDQARKPNNIPKIGYFSLHDINSYPCELGDMEKVKNASLNLNAHGQFIHNVHLEYYETVDQFWKLYEEKYSVILAKAKEFLTKSIAQWKQVKGNQKKKPKAAIFLSAGFDASEHEGSSMQRHKVHVPTAFYSRFTQEATLLAEDESTYCGGRVLSVLEGGYSNRAITSGVMAHVVGLATAPLQLFGQPQTPYESSWWNVENLMELEKQEKKKKPRAVLVGNYLSATCASVARSVEPAKVSPIRSTMPLSPTSAAPPPPPKPVFVDWATASFELAKKFIPENMRAAQIEEPPLTPTEPVRPASRSVARSSTAMGTRPESKSKNRHSVIGVEAEVPGNTRVLRERKAKAPLVVPEKQSRADRRRTVAVTQMPDPEPVPKVEPVEVPKKAVIKLAPTKQRTGSGSGPRPATAMASSRNFTPPSSDYNGAPKSRQPAAATGAGAARGAAGSRQAASTGTGPTKGSAPASRRPSTAMAQSTNAPPRTLTRKSSAASMKSTASTSTTTTTKSVQRKPTDATTIETLTSEMSNVNLDSVSPTTTTSEADAVLALEAEIARKQAELERAKQLKQQQNFQKHMQQQGAPAPPRGVSPARALKVSTATAEVPSTTQKELTPIQLAAARFGGAVKSPLTTTPTKSTVDNHLPSPPSSDKGSSGERAGSFESHRLEPVDESSDDEMDVDAPSVRA